jgi:hypothetical protein
MVKITYDENNKEEFQMIENYFWYKQYVESLLFDWGEKIAEAETMYKPEKLEILQLVINYLNESELKRAIEIHKGIYSKNITKRVDAYDFLADIVRLRYKPTKILKNQLIQKFGEK